MSGQACSSGVECRPRGTGKLSMNSLPYALSKSGIIGVSVGPGLMQLTRMPFAARVCDAQSVHTMMASFDGPYPPSISSG